MKNAILTIALVFVSFLGLNAQSVSDNAIGLRFGGNNGFGGEVSYQRKLSDKNRLEVNLGLRNEFSDFKATGLYQWVWHLEDKFNWYAGFGGGILNSAGTNFFGAGVIGIEYNFDIPLVISLDLRPEIGSGVYDDLNTDLGLGVRYQF
jgi:hypothetical protein